MRRPWLLTLPFPFLLLACGGSDAGSIFDKPLDQDTGGTSATDGAPATDSTSPTEDTGEPPPPPRDSGTPVEDTGDPPPPVDTGVELDTGLDTGLPPVDTGGCTDPGGKTFGGHCYFPTPLSRYWTTSRDGCTAVGAHLVTITSAEENAFVATFATTGERWIGLYRPDGTSYNASSYRWVTTETGTYRNWDSSEPNFSGQCVRMRSNGRWADQSCSINLIAICERE